MNSRKYYVGDCVEMLLAIKAMVLENFDDMRKPKSESGQRIVYKLSAYAKLLDGYTEMYKWRAR